MYRSSWPHRMNSMWYFCLFVFAALFIYLFWLYHLFFFLLVVFSVLFCPFMRDNEVWCLGKQGESERKRKKDQNIPYKVLIEITLIKQLRIMNIFNRFLSREGLAHFSLRLWLISMLITWGIHKQSRPVNSSVKTSRQTPLTIKTPPSLSLIS